MRVYVDPLERPVAVPAMGTVPVEFQGGSAVTTPIGGEVASGCTGGGGALFGDMIGGWSRTLLAFAPPPRLNSFPPGNAGKAPPARAALLVGVADESGGFGFAVAEASLPLDPPLASG